MKRLNLVLVLSAVLALVGIVFAQQESSHRVQPQQNTATDYAAGSWYCPMMGQGWTNYMYNNMPAPRWRGNGNFNGRRAYGPMGPGMMYPDAGPVTNESVPPSQSARAETQPQKPLPKQ